MSTPDRRRGVPGAQKPRSGLRPPSDRYRDVVRERIAEIVAHFALSPREREVFELLLFGHTADEIAHQLGVSTRTVKFHQTNLLDKLDIDSRLDLFRLFFAPE